MRYEKEILPRYYLIIKPLYFMENTSNIYRLFTYLLLLSEAFNQIRYMVEGYLIIPDRGN